MAPSKVAAPRCTRKTAGKISTSQAATQVVESTKRKRKRKRARSAVLADTTTTSSHVETTDVDDGEGDIESPKATAASSVGTPHITASPRKQAVETPCQASKTQERPASSTDPVGDLGSQKRVKKASPKPCKPALGRQPSKSRDPLTALLRVLALVLLLTQVFLYEQSSPDDVRERQERLMQGGVWEQDVGGGVTGNFGGRRDEHDRRGWGDGSIQGGQGWNHRASRR
jgi:hypothetical protein